MRVPGYGRVDRSQTIRFSFDGHRYKAHPGDTVASALLANGIRLMGRSFKYHRPRGVMTAGPEEPNALLEVGEMEGRRPNIRATVQEVYDGLVTNPQNCWPALRFDLLSANDLFAPFLGAGFYYKTFMWPKSFWEKVYEPTIRRAAGLGRLGRVPDPMVYEKAFAHCDLLVIGGGPAGLMAALTAAEAGAQVILCDEHSEPGGRLLSEAEEIDGRPAMDWVEETVGRLRFMENVRVMPRTVVIGAYDQGTFGAYERVSEHARGQDPALPKGAFWRINARATVLAAGALERPIAHPDNDRPGIMMASGVRSYLHRYGVAPGQEIAVFATHDDGARTVRDLQAAGLTITAYVDAREGVEIDADVPTYSGARVVGTRGRQGLRSITVQTSDGQERRFSADCLALAGGWSPTLHLTSHMGARPRWQPDLGGFVPAEKAVDGLFPAGATKGIFSTSGCLEDGAAQAVAALAEIGLEAKAAATPRAEESAGEGQPLWEVKGKRRAWLDFQNDVTTKDVRLSAQEGYSSVEHMKRYTTQGMAPDQGKNSNISALAVLAEATDRSIPETGTTTYRPPYSPVPLGALGAGAKGKGFQPERFTTSHEIFRDLGAPFVEAGLWYRPSYVPRSGEASWLDSCNREVGLVRSAVGVTDVSTLGKIDLQGPDVGAFLDFVYTNRMSTLKPGRTRYGIMLREDGHIMDDGTLARLSEDHWLMTTTTAAAGQVMMHLEFVHQAYQSHRRVRFTSATDHWAQFAVAGPRSRDLLNTLLDTPISDDSFPFMENGPVSIGGTPGRLYRISFSGEHAYEIAVPARHGASLFRLLLAQAETFGGGVYGMEALNVLRIEKGFPTHAELHGRTTAFDLGLQRMMSTKKDFIGRAMAARPGLIDEDREQLVGLKPVGPGGRLLSGAHIYGAGVPMERPYAEGYLTSNCFSPVLGHEIALGFLKRGRARHGERLAIRDHLRKQTLVAEVCDPVFFDPDGGRARG